MVTPLSSRIISLEAKVKIKNTSYRKHAASTKMPWQLESRRKRISGYTADRDSPSQVVPAEKRFRAEQVELNAKRRKIEEGNFQAHNVKKDLANANMNSGVKCCPKARNLVAGSIDISNVELVMAKDHKPDIVRDVRLGWDKRAYVDTFSAYASLMDAVKPLYKDSHFKAGFQRRAQWTSAHKASSTTSCSTGVFGSLNIDSEYEDDAILTPSLLMGQDELPERKSVAHDDVPSEQSKPIASCSTVTNILCENDNDEVSAKGYFSQAAVVIG
jgi:hypothetical protein